MLNSKADSLPFHATTVVLVASTFPPPPHHAQDQILVLPIVGKESLWATSLTYTLLF